nr:hypothetical protein CTI12_AA278560 [Tanacetum cinerariifolium]
MSYYPKGHRYDSGDEVDDFDDFDSTPYGGGYDIALTYGRPLPPSEETCYTATSSSGAGFDYESSNYSSHSEAHAYGQEALDNEYSSYVKRKPRPGVTHQPGGVAYGGGGGGGGGSGYEEEQGYGSGYGRRQEEEERKPEYGSGYGRRQEEEEGKPEYGSGYGRRQEEEEPKPEYGSGYGRRQEEEEEPKPVGLDSVHLVCFAQ